jgi:HSP20 family protein
MAFSRWDPLHDLLAINERLDQFVLGTTHPPGWTPPVDLYETADHYVVTAEVPGLPRESIDLRVHDGQLTLKGVRPQSDVPCEQYHRVERGHGGFIRTLALPDAIDAAAVTADLRDGVLTVTVPKAANRGSRRINVA